MGKFKGPGTLISTSTFIREIRVGFVTSTTNGYLVPTWNKMVLQVPEKEPARKDLTIGLATSSVMAWPELTRVYVVKCM